MTGVAVHRWALIAAMSLSGCGFPPISGEMEVAFREEGGREAVLRGPIHSGGVLGCGAEPTVRIFIGDDATGASVAILPASKTGEPIVDVSLRGVGSDPAKTKILRAPGTDVSLEEQSAGGMSRYALRAKADAPAGESALRSVDIRADFSASRAAGQGAYWYSYTPCP